MEEPLRKLNRCGSRNLGILKPEAGEELLQGIKRRIITLQKIADGEPRLTQIPQNLFRVLIGKPGNFCLFPLRLNTVDSAPDSVRVSSSSRTSRPRIAAQ